MYRKNLAVSGGVSCEYERNPTILYSGGNFRVPADHHHLSFWHKPTRSTQEGTADEDA